MSMSNAPSGRRVHLSVPTAGEAFDHGNDPDAKQDRRVDEKVVGRKGNEEPDGGDHHHQDAADDA